MQKSTYARYLAAAVACWILAGCASVPPVAYSGLESSSYLKANQLGDSERVPYRYDTQSEWRSYRKLIIDPVTVYRGPDNQLGDMSAEDKAALASYMQAKFSERLRSRFEITNAPAPNTLRLKLILTGAETTTAAISTLSRFDIAGGIYNSVQAVRGGKGAFTGSVTYAVEIYDAATNRLLNAYVAKQYPNAMNIGATFGSLSASRTGIDKGADALVAQFR